MSAFCDGHPRSTDLDTDTEHLVRKFRAGADFAIAQLFFQPEDFLRLRDRIAARGCDAVLLPGIMPWTTPRTLARMVDLSGARVPSAISRRLDPLQDDPAAFRAEGMDLVTALCERLLAEGVPSLHFYTFNRAKATKEILGRLDLVPDPAGRTETSLAWPDESQPRQRSRAVRAGRSTAGGRDHRLETARSRA